MDTLIKIIPFLSVGTALTVLGALKVYGLATGVSGGGEKPLTCRLLGSCPSWSRSFNCLVTLVFCVIDLANLAIVVVQLR